ncbi:WD40/YVTN/BNR-like repeat-containing protein [Clostridium thermopalmarium]|uniref:Ycf48-like protein n=1 Tax=Clostridium thermopalmarium DSM 5974 TaxID=1121340 RepID=A0A2T0ANX7_9CLOT|nr:hypothetical protein [Clostridium thermopalmarium]PRR70729.1 hypothetical protein CPAL_18130 [Clostridium thermopalmarium DSM 5974]PVZ22589.1 hypothetical protein LX19_01858 [Clostridium thermopalmarium DSM 5974]
MFKKITFCILILLGIVILAMNYKNIFGSPKTVHAVAFKPINMYEAYKLSLLTVKKLNKNAQVCYISSVDDPKLKDMNEGVDGKRRFWNLDFAVPKTDQHYIVTIHDKDVVSCKAVKSVVEEETIMNDEKSILNASNRLKDIKDKYNINPSIGWASGYHFRLNLEDNKYMVTVIGTDNSGNMAKIFVDSLTGNIDSAIHKIRVGGGLFKEKNKIQPLESKIFGAVGAAKADNFQGEEVIAIWGFSGDSESSIKPVSLITADGGQSWKKLKLNYNIARLWFSSGYKKNKTMYIVADSGAYVSKDDGDTWVKTIDISGDIIYGCSINRNNVSIVTQKKLYISNDEGNNWTIKNVPEGAQIIKSDLDEKLIMIKNNQLFIENSGGWIKLSTPLNDDIEGLEVKDNSIIIYNSKKIAILNKNTNKWTMLEVPVQIKNIFIDQSLNGGYSIYIYTPENSLYKLKQGGDFIEWTNEKIDVPQYEQLVTIISGYDKKLYFCTVPQQRWEEIKKGM